MSNPKITPAALRRAQDAWLVESFAVYVAEVEGRLAAYDCDPAVRARILQKVKARLFGDDRPFGGGLPLLSPAA